MNAFSGYRNCSDLHGYQGEALASYFPVQNSLAGERRAEERYS
jgi:hypothetical protein